MAVSPVLALNKYAIIISAQKYSKIPTSHKVHKCINASMTITFQITQHSMFFKIRNRVADFNY